MMYVIRFDHKGILWEAVLFEKTWSDSMFSNTVNEINSKKFLFHHKASRWANKEIARKLFEQHKLEIIHG